MPTPNSPRPSAGSTQPPLFPSGQSAKSADNPPRRKFAASWSESSRRFANRCIHEWNGAFGSHGVRANHVRRNHFAAVQVYRWLASADNAGSAGLQACVPMTEDDVFVAIGLYASDPHNAKHCNGRYQDFHSWMSGCPDNVDKQLSRVGRPRGTKPADPKHAAARDYAEQLLGPPLNLGDLARVATQVGDSIEVHVRHGLFDLRRGVGARVSLADPNRRKQLDQAEINRYSAIQSLIERFEAASESDRRRFAERARQGVAALAVVPGRPLEGPNLRYALALALFVRDRRECEAPAEPSACGTGLPTGQSGSGRPPGRPSPARNGEAPAEPPHANTVAPCKEGC